MRYFVSMFLVMLLDSTNASKLSSVDVALETILEFDKTVSQDFVNKLQNVLNEVKRIFSQKSKKNDLENEQKPYKFADFLKDVIIETKSLKDADLVKLLDLVHYEISLLDLEDTNLEFRRFMTRRLGNIKGNPKRIRKNLDNLLTNLRNNHRDRKDNFFLNVLNSLYKKNSERKLANIMSSLNIFRRKSMSDDELRKLIKRAIKSILSDLNVTEDKRKILKNWLEDLNKKENTNLNDIRLKYDTFHLKSNNKYVTGDMKAKKYYRAIKKVTKNKGHKLTHITLYPENLDFLNKRKVTTLSDNVDETSSEDDKSKSEIEIKERAHTESKSDESTIEDDTNEVAHDDKKKNSNDLNTISTKNIKSYRYKNDNIEATSKKHDEKSIEMGKEESASTSVEYFGNLYRHRGKKQKSRLKNKVTTDSVLKMTNDNFRTDNKRRANYRFEIENNKTTLKNLNANLKNKITTTILTNNSNTTTSKSSKSVVENITQRINLIKLNTSNFTTLETTKSAKILKNITGIGKTESSLNTITISNNIINKINISFDINNRTNNSEFKNNETQKVIERKMNIDLKDVEKVQNSFNTTTVSFDINNYLKNSEIQDIKDAEKKKEIERKMKEDLNSLFSLPVPVTNTSTTDAYTDIFKDLEDEFDLS